LYPSWIPDPTAAPKEEGEKFIFVLPFFVATYHKISVTDPDPDPPDPHVFGPLGSGSGSTSQRFGSGFGTRSFYHHAKTVRKTLIPTIL
jgi:hypothetical protein